MLSAAWARRWPLTLDLVVISTIIPTLDEESSLPGLLAALRQQSAAHEVIVVDGGSRDRTLKVARNSGARTFVSGSGRGAGLSIGAEAARGDVLFFLHADSALAPGALDLINKALAANTNIIGGNFRLVFDGDTDFSRWLTRFCAWIRLLGFYYGDSGIGTLCAASSGLDGLVALRIRRLSRHRGASQGEILWRLSTGCSEYMRCTGSAYHPIGFLNFIRRRHHRSTSESCGFSSNLLVTAA